VARSRRHRRITACADVNTLDAWLDRAVTAVSVRAVFGDG